MKSRGTTTTLTVKVVNTRTIDYRTETETLCDIENQSMSPHMMAAALRALADEIYPQPAQQERAPF